MVISMARAREISDWQEAFTVNSKPTDEPGVGDTIVIGMNKKYLVGHVLGCQRVRINYITDAKPAVMTQYQMARQR